jgi:hypothetical protein
VLDIEDSTGGASDKRGGRGAPVQRHRGRCRAMPGGGHLDRLPTGDALMLTGAALCPATPLLHPAVTGRAAVIPELRAACARAVTQLLTGVANAGTGRTGPWEAQ